MCATTTKGVTMASIKTWNVEEPSVRASNPKFFGTVPFECGAGWADIIAKMGHDMPRGAMATQIKEKFGLLRVYFDVLSDSEQVENAIIERAGRASRAAEEKSAKTCELCGSSTADIKPGSNPGPWLRTRCKEHDYDNA